MVRSGWTRRLVVRGITAVCTGADAVLDRLETWRDRLDSPARSSLVSSTYRPTASDICAARTVEQQGVPIYRIDTDATRVAFVCCQNQRIPPS